MFTITTGTKREIVASEDHSLICYNSETGLIEKTKPKTSINKLTPLAKSLIKNNDSNDEKEGWFVGAIVGDGWANAENTKSFKTNKNNVMLANSDKGIQKAMQDFLGYKGYSLTNTHDFKGHASTSTKTTWSSEVWANYIREEIGTGAKNKHLPRNFLFKSENYRFGLLAGLIDTDGTVTKVKAKIKKNPQYMCSYTTISEELHYQIQQLAASLGIRNSVCTYMRNNLVYNIYLYMNDLIPLKDKINLKSEKKNNLLQEATTSIDRKDIVPIKFTLAKYIQKNLISQKENSALYVQISRAKRIGTISRKLALKLCISYRPNNKEFKNWRKEIVQNKNLSWDIIKKIEPSKETIGYDLTVPGPYVFMLSNLMTVQDTMAVHVPIGLEAVNEAWNMLPSKNIFKHGDNAVVPEISQEYQFGLYFLTKAGKNTNKTFNSISEARKANLDLTDVFTLKNKKTTMGRELVNKTIPTKLRVYDKAFNKTVVNNILTAVAKNYPNDFSGVINSFKDLWHQYAHERSSTVSLTDFIGSRQYRDSII